MKKIISVLSVFIVLSIIISGNLFANEEMQDEELELLLFEEIPVVITASKTAESADLAPATIYVITQEQIKGLGLRDLKDILAIVPGVDISNNDFFLQGGQRGFIGPFSQSLVLINGREMNNLIAGETFFSAQFLSNNIKQVEIIAGPGSALYGANAVGGIINIITKTAEDVDGFEVSVNYGSTKQEQLDILFGGESGEFKVFGSLSYYRANEEDFSAFLSDVVNVSPAAENNTYRHLPDVYGYDNTTEALPISLYVENKGLYAGVEYYKNISGRGTASIQWDYNDAQDYRELFMKYIGYKKDNLWDDKLDLKVEYRHYWEQFWGNHTEGTGALLNPDTNVETTTDTTLEDVAAYRGFYSNKKSEGSKKDFSVIEGVYRYSDNNTIVAGFDYDKTSVVGAAWSRVQGKHPLITENEKQPQYTNYKYGLYLQDQAKFYEEKIILTLGGRFVSHERYENQFLPRSGVVYKLTEKSIFKVLYGKSFREPTVFELSSAAGNSLSPMSVDTYEIGWHQYLGNHFKNQAVVFYNKAKDRIVSDDIQIVSNGGEFTSQGLEEMITLKYEKIRAFLNYTYMAKAENTDQFGMTTNVFDLYKHKVNLGVTYEIFENYSIGGVVRYLSEVDTQYQGNIYTIPACLVVDGAIHITKIPWLDGEVSADLMVKNIFDKEYYNSEPRDTNILKHPQESRSVLVKVTIKI